MIQCGLILPLCSVRLSQAELDVEVGERMTIKVYKGEVEVFNTRALEVELAGTVQVPA